MSDEVEETDDEEEVRHKELRRLANDKREIERQARRAALRDGYVEAREDVETDWLRVSLANQVFRDAYIGALQMRGFELELKTRPSLRDAVIMSDLQVEDKAKLLAEIEKDDAEAQHRTGAPR